MPDLPHLATRCLVLVLTVMLIPGLVEGVENLWHLAEEGHAAHATSEGVDHDRSDDDEHGCTGTFHLCSCHHASSTLPIAPATLVLGHAVRSSVAIVTLPPPPFLAGLFRPPQS